MSHSDWLALIKEFIKKQALNQVMFYGIQVKYFLAFLTFLFLVRFP